MNILIIEDEQTIANRLLRMTKAFFGTSMNQFNHCDALSEGLDFINQNEIDLLLLDLNLNGENGFDILKKVLNQPFHTIIVSAYKDKAIQAFEYGVLDFVPKPFTEKRLNLALERVDQDSFETASSPATKFLSIIKRGNQHLIALSQVAYIKGARIYTEIHLKNGTKAIHNKSLDRLIQLLPDNFERIHKSYIVNMLEVEMVQVESGGKYTAILKSGPEVPISRTKYKTLKSRHLI